MNKFFQILPSLGVILWSLVPTTASACATCYGAPDSPLTKGMNMAILSLLVVIGGVLGGIVAFIFHLRRQSRKASVLS